MALLAWLWLPLLTAAPTPSALSGDLAVLAAPVWLDGGKRLAFPARDGKTSHWYTVPVAGGPPVLEEPEPAPDSTERVWWAPQADRYAYAGSEHGRHSMYVQVLGAKEPMAYAVIGRVPSLELAWSPSGNRLAFPVEVPPSAAGHYDLFAAEADGAHGTRITMRNPPTGIAWNPAGTAYVYCNNDHGRAVLMLCRHDEHVAFALADYLVPLAGSLCWTPDGKWIYFSGHLDPGQDKRKERPQPTPRLFRIRAEPRMVPEIVDKPGYVGDLRTVFSADSRLLAWIAGPLSTPRHGQMYVGRTNNPGGATRVTGGVGAGEAVFTRSGQVLFFTRYDHWEPPVSSLCWLRPDKPEEVFTLDAGPCASHPVLSPDETRLAYLGGEPGRRCLKVVDLQPPAAPALPARP